MKKKTTKKAAPKKAAKKTAVKKAKPKVINNFVIHKEHIEYVCDGESTNIAIDLYEVVNAKHADKGKIFATISKRINVTTKKATIEEARIEAAQIARFYHCAKMLNEL